MSVVTSARAYANNSVAFVAWQAPNLPQDCLGFEVTRIASDGTASVLPAWVPFAHQKNPDWKPQDTSVWPIQKFMWRDLTVRQSHKEVALHAQDMVSYLIRPVGPPASGRVPVQSGLAKTYTGDPVPLAYIDEGLKTAPVDVTSEFGPLSVAFNNGILSTQWLSHAIKNLSKPKLVAEIGKPASKIRGYLAGDLPGMFQRIFDRLKAGGELYLALYELTDPVLFELIRSHASQVRLILSNTGANDAKPPVWDLENKPHRDQLHQAGMAEMHDRFFNNNGHIGHNKFAVYVDAQGKPAAVLSGSTNWTPNGLCAQSNNAYIAELPALAAQFLDYWQALKADNALFTPPATPGATTKNAQGETLRSADMQGLKAVPLSDQPARDGAVRLWRSPNTKAKSKPAQNPARPPDMDELFYYIQNARQAVFFAVFLPSAEGANSVISASVEAAGRRNGPLVYGVVSSAMAMPNARPLANRNAGPATPANHKESLFTQDRARIVLATALTAEDATGDFEKELLSAGNAIIHDKVLVVDPLDPEGCVVATGSHNLGYKASYANDDNLLIIRRQPLVAQAYMVHVLDLYEHYRFRGIQADRKARGLPTFQGFLPTDGSWQDRIAKSNDLLHGYLG